MPSLVATLLALVVELRATIAEQRATIVRLEERVRDLETRVGQHSGNSSRPPSSDLPGTPKRPPSRPSGRGRGGQPGHVAHQRAMAPPERVDVVTDHWPPQCQACKTVLPQAPGAPDFVAHQVTELPVIRPRITEHRLVASRQVCKRSLVVPFPGGGSWCAGHAVGRGMGTPASMASRLTMRRTCWRVRWPSPD